MKILVTGGAGFIGSHLVERLLKDGHEVAVFDDFNDYYDPQIKWRNLQAVRDDIRIIEGDLRDSRAVDLAFADFKPTTLAHLAARAGVIPSVKNPALYEDCNVNGTLLVLEAAKKHAVERMIFASSSSVYGVNEKVPFAEDDPITRTISPYAATKIAGEQLCSTYAHELGMNTVCLRFFTVHGPRQRPDLAIAKFIRLIQEGSPIDRYGDGSSSRDYTYIDDIIQGVMSALRYEGSPFEIFNLGGSKTVTLNQLIETIESVTGTKAIINALPEQVGDVPRTNADLTKSGTLLDYHPKTSIRDGIAKYMEWLQELKAGSMDQ